MAATLSLTAQDRPVRQKMPRVDGVKVFYNIGDPKQRVSSMQQVLTVLGDEAATSMAPNPDAPKDGEDRRSRRKSSEESRPQRPTPTESTYIDYATMRYYNMAVLPKGDTVTVEVPFEYADLKQVGKDTICNMECIQLRTSINSNTIDIWYTTKLKYRGTIQPASGVPDGLVLRVARNGRISAEAVRVDMQTNLGFPIFPSSWGTIIDAADYRYTLNQSVVETVNIFDRNRICFNGKRGPDKFEGDTIFSVGGGSVILRKVKLPSDVEDMSIFAEMSQYSDGDAYDRTGSIFVIPVDKRQSFLDALGSKGIASLPSFVSDTNSFPGIISTPDYQVPVELMRFFTSFGVRKFNHIKVKGQQWVDSVIYKQDVTHLASMLRDEVWIAAYIGNWDGNGHKLSLKLKYHPGGRGAAKKVVIPLFNTVNLLEQAGQTYPTFFDKDSLRVSFNIAKNMKNVQLVYLTTGHGGWGGGDEFNQKLNTIYLDGAKIFSFIPWREDCATYRNWNPCSGNFSNGVSSSDLSRSNWCPGSVTNPVYVPIGSMTAGEHSMSVQIPLGEPEGGSFSYWCISGVLIGEIEQE